MSEENRQLITTINMILDIWETMEEYQTNEDFIIDLSFPMRELKMNLWKRENEQTEREQFLYVGQNEDVNRVLIYTKSPLHLAEMMLSLMDNYPKIKETMSVVCLDMMYKNDIIDEQTLTETTQKITNRVEKNKWME